METKDMLINTHKTIYQVSVYDITFYLHDADGNEKLDKHGNVQEYTFEGTLEDLEYLCEDMTEEDLTKINKT